MARKSKKQASDNQPKARRGLFRRGCATILFGGLLLVGALVFFAPTIVARTSLLQQIVPLAAPDFEGQVTIANASLGWFSPIELREVTAVDASGEPLLSAAKIGSEKTLFALVSDRQRLGRFRIEQPQLHLKLRDDGSNVEDAIAPLLKPSKKKSAPIQVSIEIVDGQVEVTDLASRKSWGVRELNVSAAVPDASRPITAKINANVNSPAERGTFEADLSWQTSSESGELAVKSQSLPLEMIQSIVRRFVPESTVRGSLTSNLHYVRSSGATGHSIQINEFDVQQLHLGAPQWIGGDQLQLALLTAGGSLAIDGDQITTNGLRVNSDLAKLEANGTMQLKHLARDLLPALLQQQDYRISGEVDLALLAKMFPQTMRVREATEITSGKISATLFSRVENESRRWLGVVETANLTAVNNGKLIRWDQPIQVTMSAANSTDGPVIEQLACESSFLHLKGKGTLASGNVTGTGNLDRLANELGQFFDLKDVKLAGGLAGALNWQRSDGDRLVVNGNATVENYELVVPGGRPWREQRLDVVVNAVAVADQQGVKQLDRASIQVKSGNDLLDAKLTAPVSDFTHATALPVNCDLRGDLATWLPRIQVWVPLAGWDLDGEINLTGSGTVTKESIDIASSRGVIKQFRAAGPGLTINEPQVVAEVVAVVDLANRKVSTKTATLTNSSVSLRADNTTIELNDGGFNMNGDVAFRGNLARLMAWTYAPNSLPAQHLFGQVDGRASFAHKNGVTFADWTANVDEFHFARRRQPSDNPGGVVAASRQSPWQSVWYEQAMKLKGKADYSHVNGEVNLQSVDVVGGSMRISTNGKITELASRCRVDLVGELGYDLPGVAEKLRPHIGQDLQVTGKGSRPFSVRGPLLTAKETSDSPQSTWPPDDLTAKAAVAWTSASLQGFTFGEGEMRASLSKGVVHVEPIEMPVNEGRVKLAPRIYLKEKPAHLVFDKGTIIDRVYIAPEMCRSWLKFVAPLLADATRTEGRMSVDLAGAKLPLVDPASGSASGALHIHSAQIGPGPLGQEFLGLGQQVLSILDGGALSGGLTSSSRQLITMPEQKVDFQMTNGRVSHEGLHFKVAGTTIRTRGSVGTDQSLALVAQIPIGAQLVGSEPLFAGLKGKTIEVPIRGTLSRPQVDSQVLSKLTKQLLGGSVEKLINDELIKGLDGLFGPRK